MYNSTTTYSYNILVLYVQLNYNILLLYVQLNYNILVLYVIDKGIYDHKQRWLKNILNMVVMIII